MKLLEKADVLEAVGSDGSSNTWNMEIRLCTCLEISLHGAILDSQAAAGRGRVGRGRLPRYDISEALLHLIFLMNFPHLIFADVWHKTESSSVSLRICLGQK